MLPISIDALTGYLLIASAALLGLREIFLSPMNSTFPCAPGAVRVAMFIAAATMAGFGSTFFGGQGGVPHAGQAATSVCVLAGVMVLYNGIMLVNVIQERRPAATWARIRRITSRAQVRRRKQPVTVGIDPEWML